MKAKLVSAGAVSLLSLAVLGNSVQAESLTKIDRGVNTYEAVTTKAITGYDRDNFSEIKYPKGKKIVIVERQYKHGYDYIVTKGNVYFQFDHKAIKVTKRLPGKTDYSKYKMSSTLVNELKKLGKNHKDYQAYKKAAISYEKLYQKMGDKLFNDKLALQLQHQAIVPRGMTSPNAITYKDWTYKREPEYKVNKCKVNPKYQFDIMDKAFIKQYMSTSNKTVKGIAPGVDIGKYQACELYGSGYGYAFKAANVGFSITQKYKSKDVFIYPTKKYTYDQVIQQLGKPTSTKYVAKGVHEYQATYQKKGYKVIVGFDQFKGDLKYLVKK